MDTLTDDEINLIAQALPEYADICDQRAEMFSGHPDPHGDAAAWKKDAAACRALWGKINAEQWRRHDLKTQEIETNAP